MLELLLTLLNDERNDDARNQSECNRHDYTKVESLAIRDPLCKHIEHWEGCRHSLEVGIVRASFLDDRLVYVLGEVRDGHARCSIDEQVDLEIGGVRIVRSRVTLHCLIELIGAESVGLGIANILLISHFSVIV